jgi:pilus assembly protein Flp/PilA
MNLLKKFWKEEDGQDMVEYALLLALISVVSIAAIRTLGTDVNGVFTTVNGQI